MNCYKFATIKSGTLESSFSIKLTRADSEIYTGSLSYSTSLDLGLTYKDLCRIEKGKSPGKPWFIRGPGCEFYHRYRGAMYYSGYLGAPGDFGAVYVGQPGYGMQHNLLLYVEYDMVGSCVIEKFDGRLNAYGRKAKKASEQANTDPDNDEPCPADWGMYALAVPIGASGPPYEGVESLMWSTNAYFAYSKTNNQEHTSNGIFRIYIGTNDMGEPQYMTYLIEITGKRDLNIEENYGG